MLGIPASPVASPSTGPAGGSRGWTHMQRDLITMRKWYPASLVVLGVIAILLAAEQIDRGILKTGKEADVHLVERRPGDRRNLLAAERYGAAERRQFRDDSRYRQARRTGNRRSAWPSTGGPGPAWRFGPSGGRPTSSTYWGAYGRPAWPCLPGPAHRQRPDGRDLGDHDGAAPRLVPVTPAEDQAADLFAQAIVNIRLCTRRGVVHGDPSPHKCSSRPAGSSSSTSPRRSTRSPTRTASGCSIAT